MVSSSGVIHYVRDEAALKTLAGSDDRLHQDLRKLAGLRIERSDAKALPRHKQHWQLLERVVWLERVDTGELLPIIGGEGTFYVDNFCGKLDSRADTHSFVGHGSRLNTFMNNGYVHSTTRSYEFGQRGSNVRWLRRDLGFVPSNPEQHGLLDIQSGPFQVSVRLNRSRRPCATTASRMLMYCSFVFAPQKPVTPVAVTPAAVVDATTTTSVTALPAATSTHSPAAPMEVEAAGIEPIELNFFREDIFGDGMPLLSRISPFSCLWPFSLRVSPLAPPPPLPRLDSTRLDSR